MLATNFSSLLYSEARVCFSFCNALGRAIAFKSTERRANSGTTKSADQRERERERERERGTKKTETETETM